MYFLKYILKACFYLTALLFLIYLYCFVHSLYERIRFKLPIPWSELKPSGFLDSLVKSPVAKVIVVFIVIVGVGNAIASKKFASHEIGAFYEEKEYSETYEATLYFEEKAIFCLAEMHHDTYEDEDRKKTYSYYWIDEIRLPYGHAIIIDEEYEPEKTNCYSVCGASLWNDYDCDIVLIHPATSNSYDLLRSAVVTSYGPCCASRDSDKFHFLSCPSVANIREDNLVFFQSPEEADLLGFEGCDLCIYE